MITPSRHGKATGKGLSATAGRFFFDSSDSSFEMAVDRAFYADYHKKNIKIWVDLTHLVMKKSWENNLTRKKQIDDFLWIDP